MEQKIDDLNDVLKCLEYAMQWEWGFDRNESYHSWWFKPKNCICPKIDNREMLGFGKIVVHECPVHGYLPDKKFIWFSKAEDFHYLRIIEPSWTLLLEGKPKNKWGFMVNGKLLRPLRFFNKFKEYTRS